MSLDGTELGGRWTRLMSWSGRKNGVSGWMKEFASGAGGDTAAHLEILKNTVD